MQLPVRKTRIDSIDVARGIIMVIMALDHVRDFFHSDAQLFSATDLTKTTYALFFTRWVTHFCAPAFVLLAGTAIAISGARKSGKELSWYLVTRGLWLIVLDVTVMRFALLFNFYYDAIFLSVLWMIGCCMLGMAAAIHLPRKAVLAMGLFILFFHNAFDSAAVQPGEWYFPLWLIGMRVGFIPLDAGHGLITSYSLVPWLGVMMTGYGLGGLFGNDVAPVTRRKILFTLGVASIGLFVVLRTINMYGDPFPWSAQPDAPMTVLSFLNVTKYPVSLQFVLVTVGPLLILLGLLEGASGFWQKPFHTVGRVPLFYFVGHFLLAHVVALVLLMMREGKSLTEIDFHFAKSFGGIEPGSGVSLVGVYIAWIAIVAAMYFPCAWYEKYKRNHHDKWLSYL